MGLSEFMIFNQATRLCFLSCNETHTLRRQLLHNELVMRMARDMFGNNSNCSAFCNADLASSVFRDPKFRDSDALITPKIIYEIPR